MKFGTLLFLSILLLSLIGFLPKSFAGELQPSGQYKLHCIINTYNLDGSDFKTPFLDSVEIDLNKLTEIYRSAKVIYSVIYEPPTTQNPKMSSLYVQLKPSQGAGKIAAARVNWTTAANLDPEATVYSDLAEPGVETMFECW